MTGCSNFDEKHILHELKHYLPSQQALKDFVHHNTLHAFQHMKFYDALNKASAIFGYQTTLQLEEFRQLYHNGRIREDILQMTIARKKGKAAIGEWKNKLLYSKYDTTCHPRTGRLRRYWKEYYMIDMNNQVHPVLFRILCSFLDQGVSLTRFPVANQSFLESIKKIEQNNYCSFFKTKKIRNLFLNENYSITTLLKTIVGNEQYFSQYLFDQQFAHHGWSGFVSSAEDNPRTLLDRKEISLRELIIFELLLELDTLQYLFKNKWQPLGEVVTEPPADLFSPPPESELNEVIELWQDAFEWSYYDSVLAAMQKASHTEQPEYNTTSFQAIFCIDERECSLRRHIESSDPYCETLGAPGFFGVEFYFQQQNSRFYDKLCPAPVTPSFLIKEHNAGSEEKKEPLYTKHTHHLLGGFFLSITMGFWALIRTIQNLFTPKMSPAISNAYAHMSSSSSLTIENTDENNRENELQIGYSIQEMTSRASAFLQNIGLIKNFAPVVYLVAHGSSSANNPHHGAHDCGACSGRPGATNARVLASILNHPKVREQLTKNGIIIPAYTQFISCMHDTAADIMGYYDENVLNDINRKNHAAHKISFEKALDLNAKERSRRFASINTKIELPQVRKAILKRSASLFEPRPELGHGTNTLCIVGRRNISKKLFLDRRAFLNSYDYRTDPEGLILTNVMNPIGPVCGGINLEYYFSRVDNIRLGAGTKLPHNVMGLFGVANSSDGDLRPGLPWQMIEVHDPVRLLVIVEHRPEIVLKAIQSSPEVFEWYKNEWVHIVALHPEEKRFYYFRNGSFSYYHPLSQPAEHIQDIEHLIESALEMETNHIADATKENLPIHLIN